MTVRIRLQRHGAKKRPFYRVVAADQRAPRDGRFIELLGTYDPLQDPPVVRLKKERVDYWLEVGAKPSETAQYLIGKLEKGEAIDLSDADSDKAAIAARRAEREASIKDQRAKAQAALAKAAEEAATKAAATETASEEEATEAPAEGDEASATEEA